MVIQARAALPGRRWLTCPTSAGGNRPTQSKLKQILYVAATRTSRRLIVVGTDQLPSRAFMAWVAPYLVISTLMKSGSNPAMKEIIPVRLTRCLGVSVSRR